MTRTFLLLALGLLIAGGALAIVLVSSQPTTAAVGSDEGIAVRCTWSEVKQCYDGVLNGCCSPKDKPKVAAP
ncbi:MAG: hypothetical protein HYZ09_01950 [Candidatus Kerfeldbacteria bacterium]|nr:hypothetical protein [Candidatus Kerfeldbacteria bacterium]